MIGFYLCALFPNQMYPEVGGGGTMMLQNIPDSLSLSDNDRLKDPLGIEQPAS